MLQSPSGRITFQVTVSANETPEVKVPGTAWRVRRILSGPRDSLIVSPIVGGGAGVAGLDKFLGSPGVWRVGPFERLQFATPSEFQITAEVEVWQQRAFAIVESDEPGVRRVPLIYTKGTALEVNLGSNSAIQLHTQTGNNVDASGALALVRTGRNELTENPSQRFALGGYIAGKFPTTPVGNERLQLAAYALPSVPSGAGVAGAQVHVLIQQWQSRQRSLSAGGTNHPATSALAGISAFCEDGEAWDTINLDVDTSPAGTVSSVTSRWVMPAGPILFLLTWPTTRNTGTLKLQINLHAVSQ